MLLSQMPNTNAYYSYLVYVFRMLQVYISHRRPTGASLLPSNVKLMTSVVRLQDGNTAILSDGDSVKIDVLLYCTGYRYAFPFFDDGDASEGDSSGGLIRITDGKRVTPLYKHVLHALHPRSLAFIGLSDRINCLPVFHFQVLYAIAAIDGSLQLPARDDLLRESEDDYRRRLAAGMPPHYAHDMWCWHKEYTDALAASVGHETISDAVNDLLSESVRRMLTDPEHFREAKLDSYDDFTKTAPTPGGAESATFCHPYSYHYCGDVTK